MEIKKLNIKKGATIKDTFLVLLAFVVAFGIIVMYVTDFATEGGVTVDPKINQTYQSLQAQQVQIEENLNTTRSAVNALDEAKLGDFAFFGIKGILALMRTPIDLINVGQNSAGLITPLFYNVPIGIRVFVSLAILITILFAIIKFITSRGQEP